MLCGAAKSFFLFLSHWEGYLIPRQRFLGWGHGGGKCPWTPGMNPGATGGWGLRRYHTMAATSPGCPSWSLSVGTGPGEMLLQANHS